MMPERKKVLLAENDPEIIEYLSSFLSFLGEFETQQILTSVELLAAVNAFEPALVILDLNTLKDESKQILGEIKKRHRTVKILAMASKQGEEKILKESGAHEIVVKPVDFTELSQKVKKLLHWEDSEKPQSARLLIADDEVEISTFLKEEIFEPLGIEVYTAQDGEEALRIFKEKACNLVLLDLKMPKINGFDLIPLLERSVHPPKPKSIMLITAALAQTLSELKRFEYQVFDKPIDLEMLKKRVLDTCEKYGLSLKKGTGTSLKAPD